jgi:hypothetical protein
MTERNPRHNASFLLYGKTKTGKSSLAATAPGKKLVADAEGSWNAFYGRQNPNNPDQPYRVTWWDDLSQPPPAMDDFDICVVDVQRWETVDTMLNWVIQPNHPFQSIILDSVTEIQNRCKKAIQPDMTGLQQQDWGKLLAHMSDRIKRFRDIVKNPANPARVVVFTSEGKLQQDGSYVPHMEGQLRNGIAYWMNTTACLRVAQLPNEDGIVTDNSPTERRLLVKPHPLFITGSHFEDRFESNAISNPNLTHIMGSIFPGFSE